MKREEPKGDEYILMKAHEGEHLKTKLLHYGESPWFSKNTKKKKKNNSTCVLVQFTTSLNR